MDEILLSKGDRLEKPRTVSVPLRRDVYNWLSKIAASECRPVSWVIRALAEDAFDHRSDQECRAMNEPRYCELCGCICVACVQVKDGCDSCELKHPELLQDYENLFTEALLDHFEEVSGNE